MNDPANRPIAIKVAQNWARGGWLYTADEIDAFIQERLVNSPTRRQVAALERERARLKRELEEARAARREREDQLGITAIQRRSGALAGEAYDVLDMMKREPVSSIEDVAALFDSRAP